MLDIGLARSHVKYFTPGKIPSDDNASSLPVFEGWFRLFCYPNIVWIVTLCKKYKKYIRILLMSKYRYAERNFSGRRINPET